MHVHDDMYYSLHWLEAPGKEGQRTNSGQRLTKMTWKPIFLDDFSSQGCDNNANVPLDERKE